ncbi:MAG: hypothetical protein L3J53_03605 [Proteobacteria bacterium]|nr:hypothetical protein [Pseudomonadota bacterium]
MKYSIIINPNSKNSCAIEHAYQFVQALLQQNHKSIHVFFYGYAVESIFFNNIFQDITTKVSLFACSTIAQDFISQGLLPAQNISIVGLGQWLESIIVADKRVEFV